jgi:hypothetical protein
VPEIAEKVKRAKARTMSAPEREARREDLIRERLGCPFLEEEEAAAYLLLNVKTLQGWRLKGGGPAYRKHGGRIAYHIDDLEAWSASTKRLTTSDKPAQATE